jgi:hypothetical protein
LSTFDKNAGDVVVQRRRFMERRSVRAGGTEISAGRDGADPTQGQLIMKTLVTRATSRLLLAAMIGLSAMGPAPAALAGTGQGGGNCKDDDCSSKRDAGATDLLERVRVLFAVADLIFP